MKTKLCLVILSLLLYSLFLSNCTAPRNVIHSGKVTSKGKVKFGGNYSFNIPTETNKEIFGSLKDAVDKTINRDSIIVDTTFNKQIRALTMYSLDPVGHNIDFYVRYGLIKNLDIGYTWASGVHVLDTRYQILNKADKFYGSIGLQYSSQSYELPSYLGKLQSLLKYEIKRKDILIPFILSNSFGEKEKYGSFAYGLCFGRTWVVFDYAPNLIYETVSGVLQEVNDVPHGKNSYNTYGLIFNLRAGYKPFYALIGLSTYYQNYGKYTLFKNEYADFSGFTFVPNLGVQISF
ncbi:MAG: hypothetical protein JNL74_16835 [Fibrobacteres bacterium]|nr:hypothetical protein [Fibrobacterota bacterium]